MSGEFEVASNGAVFGWLHPARVLAAKEAGKINSKLSCQVGGTGLERPSGVIGRLKVGSGSAQLYDDIRDTPSFSGRPAVIVLLMSVMGIHRLTADPTARISQSVHGWNGTST
jgi:hypothetical protein